MLKQLTSRGVKLLLVQPNNLRAAQNINFNAIVNLPAVSLSFSSFAHYYLPVERLWTKEKKKNKIRKLRIC